MFILNFDSLVSYLLVLYVLWAFTSAFILNQPPLMILIINGGISKSEDIDIKELTTVNSDNIFLLI